jgi:hypothetical protein
MASTAPVTDHHADPHPADDAGTNPWPGSTPRVSPQQWAIAALARVAAPMPRASS